MLYMVGTPIGNLKDITYRAVEILGSVDVIFAEDTRIASRLLGKYNIKKPMISCNAINEEKKIKTLLEYLDDGKDIAFISDAGTPGLSDPGSRLVEAAFKAGHTVFPIPGVSSFATLVSVNPFKDKVTTFEGFLPNKGLKRVKRIEELYLRGDAFILLESNHRILKLLSEIASVDERANVLVGREMTKMYEEYKAGTPLELKTYFEEAKKDKGEFTVLVSRNKKL